MKELKIKTIKKKKVELKTSKKKKLEGGNVIENTYANYIYLTKENQIRFKISDNNFKKNIVKDKHKNLEVFEHQKTFMHELLKKYSSQQTYTKSGDNYYVNKDRKVFYEADDKKGLFYLSVSNNNFNSLTECLSVETNVNNQIFFKIVFRKNESSDLIAPFILLLYPRNGKLILYLHTFIRHLKVPENISRISQDESTLDFGSEKLIPKDVEDLVQVDLIKKISWNGHKVADKTSFKSGKEMVNYLINSSGWLGHDGNRILKRKNEEGTDNMIKRVLRDMSQKWEKEYLVFPTSNQDPYYLPQNIKPRNDSEIQHLGELIEHNNLFDDTTGATAPGPPRVDHPSLSIREDNVPIIIDYINNKIPPTAELDNHPLSGAPLTPGRGAADPNIYDLHPEYKKALIDDFNEYPFKTMIGGIIHLEPSSHGSITNPWVFIKNSTNLTYRRDILIGFDDYKEGNADQGTFRPWPQETPTKTRDDFIGKIGGLDLRLPSPLPIGRRPSDRDYERWCEVLEQGTKESFKSYYKRLIDPEIDEGDLNEKWNKKTGSIPLLDEINVSGNNNATFYDVVADPSYKFRRDEEDTDILNKQNVQISVNSSTKYDNKERVGLTPFINIKENPRNRIPISSEPGVTRTWDEYAPTKGSYLWSGVMKRGDRALAENAHISPGAPKIDDVRGMSGPGKKLNHYYAVEEDYFETLVDFKKISQGFYNRDSSYFLFPHVQGFVNMNQVMDLKSFIPCDIQEDSMVVSIIVSEEHEPDFKGIPKEFFNGKRYGVNIKNKEYDIIEIDYTYALNEKYVLGNSIDQINIGQGENVVTIENLLGGSLITGANQMGQHEIIEKKDVVPVLNNNEYKILTHVYKLKLGYKHTLRASQILDNVLHKLGLDNISMSLQCPEKLDFLFVVYLLINNEDEFECQTEELNNFFDFYQKRLFDEDNKYKYKISNDNSSSDSLYSYLKTFKDILREGIKKKIQIPSCNNIDLFDIYRISQESIFLKVLFDTMISYRKNENIDFGVNLANNTGSIQLMELFNKYEENENIEVSELLGELRRINETIFNLFDSVGNLKGRESIKPLCEFLNNHFNIPVYVIIKKNDYSMFEKYGDNLSTKRTIPLILLLNDKNRVISGNKFVYTIENENDPKIFYDTKTYEEISEYEELLDIDRRSNFNSLFNQVDSNLANKFNILTNFVSSNFTGTKNNYNIIITGINKLNSIDEDKNGTTQEIMREILDKVLKIKNISISTGSERIRYMNEGDIDSDIYELSPYDVDPSKWKQIYKEMLKSIGHITCFIQLSYNVGADTKNILIVFLKEGSNYSGELLPEFIELMKRSFLFKIDTNNYYEHIWIDEDSINLSDFEDKKSKSSLILNGVILGYNKSLPEKEFKRDSEGKINKIESTALNIENLFILLCLEENRVKMMDIFVNCFDNKEQFKDLLKPGIIDPIISTLDKIRETVGKLLSWSPTVVGAATTASKVKDYILPETVTKLSKFLSEKFEGIYGGIGSVIETVRDTPEKLAKAAGEAGAAEASLAGATSKASSIAGMVAEAKTRAKLSVLGRLAIPAGKIAVGVGIIYLLIHVVNKMRKFLKPYSFDLLMIIIVLLNLLENTVEYKNAQNNEEKIEAIRSFIISISKSGSFSSQNSKFKSMGDILYVLSRKQPMIIDDDTINTVLLNSRESIIEEYNNRHTINIVTNSLVRQMSNLKSILLQTEHKFNTVDLLYYLYIKLLEGESNNRYIGKRVKFIKDESFSIPLVGLTGHIIEYDSRTGVFKIRIKLSWGSEALIYYSKKMIQQTANVEKDKWIALKVVAEEAKRISEEDFKQRSEQIFYKVISDGGLKDKITKAIRLERSSGSIDAKKILDDALKMFLDSDYTVYIRNRTSIRLLTDNSKKIGGGLNLKILLKMLEDDKNTDLSYKLLIDRINRISSMRIFLLYTSVLGRIHSVYPKFSKDDKYLNKDDVKFVSIDIRNNRKISVFKCNQSLSYIVENIQARIITKQLSHLDDNINVGYDYFVFNGNKVTDKVTVSSLADSSDLSNQRRSYMVESNINPGTRYLVDSSNLILESDFEYNTDKFIYPTGENKIISKNTTKADLGKEEMQRQLNIGIYEKINSMFDKFTSVFESVDTLFSTSLSSGDSREFLNKFISNCIVTLDSLRGVVLKSKLSKIYYVKLINIESRIQSFYDKHRDIIEEDEERLVETKIAANKELISDEDDYQGIMKLRNEQCRKLSIREFSGKINSLLAMESSDIKISGNLMKLYKKIGKYIQMKNILLLGNQGQKNQVREIFLRNFFADMKPFRLEISELVKPSTGEFFFIFIQEIITELKSHLEKMKDDHNDKKMFESSKRELEELCNSIENVNPQVKYTQEKKRSQNKENNKDDSKLKKFMELFKTESKSKKK